jgi:prepilin peptidase CpaA
VHLQSYIVLLLTLACAVTDIRRGKIYNKLTYPSAALGLGLSFVLAPPDTLLSAAGLLGALIGYGLLWRIGGMGAGDVKLMAAVGALKGLPFVFFGSFYIFCAASLAGVAVLAWRGRLLPVAKWVVGSVVAAVVPGVKGPRLEGGMTMMPFGPFIFVGTALCVALEWLHGSPFTF